MKLQLHNKRVLVLGLGETGLSVLRWLNTQGAVLSAADSRDNPPNLDALARSMPQVVIYTGAFKQSILLQAEVIVISPGVSLNEPSVQAAINQGIPVVGDVELFAQYRPKHAKVIGITGSNGKTTVTTLVGEICKAAGLKTIVAGNIGLPVLDTFNMGLADVYVLELSSFQLETTASLLLDAATVLNVCEDHMDRYDNIADYARAKARLLKHAKVAVLNRDDVISSGMASINSITFGLNAAPDVADFGLIECHDESKTEQYLASGHRKICKASDLKIVGQHNIANALAASALCCAIGIEKSTLIIALQNFKGLPHRVEWVANIDDVDYYDDSKGTNVGATCAAILGMAKNNNGHNQTQKVVLIAGGEGKDQDFSPLAPAVQANGRAVVLIGRDAALIENMLLETNTPIYHAVDLPEAVNIAKKLAKAGDAVLLSPACASFDMFKNYVHRAEVFVAAVKRLDKASATCQEF
jgi:UDP-N-acetylmuramoylalanine--D-glutamate ligase